VPKSATTGQLISLDAVRGRDLVPSAKKLLKKPKSDGGFSTWDASSIFFEMVEIPSEDRPSARTILLLYAADLRFRLRWEIEPALKNGRVVVAAPYVQTGIAFGLAMGLSQQWVTEVFRFAPEPGDAFWIDGSPPKTASKTTGFLEFCHDLLPGEFFDRFTSHFETLERQGKCRKLGD
jgi:thymidylate kinase